MNDPGYVYCCDCRFVTRKLDGRDLPAYRWTCVRAPKPLKPNFVSREHLLEEPNYRCSVANADGHCSRYEYNEAANA